MSENNKCAHGACGCPVDDDSEYCGEHCEDAAGQDIIEITCDCGHDGCVS